MDFIMSVLHYRDLLKELIDGDCVCAGIADHPFAVDVADCDILILGGQRAVALVDEYRFLDGARGRGVLGGRKEPRAVPVTLQSEFS